ncbi:DTW domain-containing protein [Maricurvus nonylphenolicus]|uniref:tRNA-uridine aminocarboxypropyltransferase n=1 Tax=Maricurvus nonylphenolicus TaxID=1008307 RepID=UPI0036F217D9
MPRLTCPHCLRPQTTCICDLVVKVNNPVEVMILQHPLEQHQAKGSARLLHMCLNNSQLAIGETFTGEDLTSSKQSVLLYPPEEESQTVCPADLNPANTRLVVLDGTWRKSRKLLHLNPTLSELPRLRLSELPASRYTIRKAHNPDQLSTLEATCLALGQIDQSPDTYQSILDAFDQFIQRLQGFMPDHSSDK